MNMAYFLDMTVDVLSGRIVQKKTNARAHKNAIEIVEKIADMP